MRNTILLCFVVIGTTLTQIVLKQTVKNVADSRGSILTAILSSSGFYVCGALTTIVCATWVVLLRAHDLSRIYPITALTYLTVPVLAKLFLDERVPPRFLAGAGITVLGLIVSGLS